MMLTIKERLSLAARIGSLCVLAAFSFPFASVAVAQDTSSPSLVLFSGLEYQGPTVTIVDDFANLDTVQFNESATSLIANGPWEVCLGIDYSVRCRTYTGKIPNLESFRNRISSVRYKGTQPRSPKPLPVVASAPVTTLAMPTSNAEIHALVRGGVNDAVIIAKVNAPGMVVDKSTAAIIELSRSGASDLVLQAVINHAVATAPPPARTRTPTQRQIAVPTSAGP